MEPPLGYVIQGQSSSSKVCKLKKAIYGLKQSPRAWCDKFSRVVGDYGMRRTVSDHSIFVCHNQNGSIIVAV